MIFLFVIPMTTGAFGNYLIPLMIGARDMAFPRLNALSLLDLPRLGALHVHRRCVIGHAPDAGWFDYVPLASQGTIDPGRNIDFYALGLIFIGISTTAAAINFIVTIFKLRAPGMSLNRMPLFCYAFLASSFALVFALPALTLAAVLPRARPPPRLPLLRRRARRRPAAVAAPVLDLRPPRGLHHHPARVRDRDVDHPDVLAPADGRLPAGRAGRDPGRVPRLRRLGAPHVRRRAADGDDDLLRRGEPDHRRSRAAIQLFAWITTIVTGTPTFKTPLLFIVGFIVFFIIGGLSGIMFAAIPFDQQVHRHLLRRRPLPLRDLRGGGVPDPRRPLLLVPEGHRADVPRAARASVSFWLTFVGHARDVLPDAHRRAAGDAAADLHLSAADLGWTLLNLLESLGAYVLAAGLLLIVVNLVVSLLPRRAGGRRPVRRRHARVGDDARRRRRTTSRSSRRSRARTDVGRARTASATTPPRARARASLDAGHETPATHGAGRRARRGPRDAAALDLAAASRACAGGGLRDAAAGHYWIAGRVPGAWRPRRCSPGISARRRRRQGCGRRPTAPRSRAAAERAMRPPPPGWLSAGGRQPNGVWGMALFLCSEATLFGTLIGSYFYLRVRRDGSGPRPGSQRPSVAAAPARHRRAAR